MVPLSEHQIDAADVDDTAKCHVQSCTGPGDLICCESVPSTGHARHDLWDRVHAFLNTTPLPSPAIQMDSQVKYCLVASGQASVYIRAPLNPAYIEKIWDHAAGALLVQEAGGKVTDLAGKALAYDHHSHLLCQNHGILASCGEPYHSMILAALSSILAKE